MSISEKDRKEVIDGLDYLQYKNFLGVVNSFSFVKEPEGNLSDEVLAIAIQEGVKEFDQTGRVAEKLIELYHGTDTEQHPHE